MFSASQLAADFVFADALIVFPYTADRDLVAQARVTMVKGMLGQHQFSGNAWGLWVGRRQGLLSRWFTAVVLLEQFGCAVAGVVWMGDPK